MRSSYEATYEETTRDRTNNHNEKTNEKTNEKIMKELQANQRGLSINKNGKNKNIYTLFDFWNLKKIIIHREIEKYKSHIASRLKKYSVEEIKEAISNYSTILKGSEYYWTHKWSLDEFLSRKGGLDKFLTANDPFSNFKNGKGQIKGDNVQTSENVAAYEEYQG